MKYGWDTLHNNIIFLIHLILHFQKFSDTGICLAEMSSLPRSVIDEALECSNHIQHREKRVSFC